MLQALSRQAATGVLTVQGQEGWKVLEIQAGSIALVTAASGKRLRIGEILLARGKITQEVLAKALAAQRTSGAPLGEILIDQGFITREEMLEIVRFQVEEEIYDLFTWRGAECTFEAGATAADQLAEYPDVARLAINPQDIFVEAARRIPIWQQIERVIYSAYMVFRLTERGATMLNTATRGGRKLLDLVQQELCVDTIVRKAMVGRFAIWKALADLVGAQAIVAVPDAEIANLVNRWESEGRLEQAWAGCLRLAETITDARRIADLRGRADALKKRLLEDEEAALHGVEETGEVEEGSSRYRTTVILLSVLVAAVMVLLFAPALRITGRPSGEDMDAFRKASRDAQKLREEGSLADAWALWDEFLAEYSEGTVSDLAQDARQIIREDYEKLVDIEIERAREMVEKKQFIEALALYKDIPRRYPRTRKKILLSELTRTAEKRKDDYLSVVAYGELVEKLKRGQDLLKEERYGEARGALEIVANSMAAGPELRQQAREKLKAIDEIETKAEELVKAARAKEDEGRLDDAIDIYQECSDLWFRSTWGQEAANRKTRLSVNRTRAERLYSDGLRLLEKGDSVGAQIRLRKAASYKGYKVAEQASQKIEDMASERVRVAELLERERRLRGQGKLDEAFGALLELADRFPRSASRLNLKLEVSIETVPSNARVFLGDQELGRSPITTLIAPRQPVVVVLRKPGFLAHQEKFEQVRSRILQFRLQKEIAYRRAVGQPVLARAAVGRPRDARTRPQLFVRAGSSLVTFAPDTGKELWRVEPGAAPADRAGPAVLGELVFVAARDRLHGYSLTGSQRLDVPVGAVAVTSPAPVLLRLLANRTFAVVACEDGTVVSFDVLAREPRWTTRVSPPVGTGLVVNEKAAFVASGGSGVVALDILDGKPLWAAPLSGEAGGDVAADPKGRFVGVVTSLGEAFVFSATDGQMQMRAPLDRARGGGMLLTDDTAFVGTDDGRLRAIDVASGVVKWSVSVEGAVRDAPVLHEDCVYVGTEEGHIVCVDALAGRVEWTYDAEAAITTSATVCEDTLIFGTHDGELVAFQVGRPAR